MRNLGIASLLMLAAAAGDAWAGTPGLPATQPLAMFAPLGIVEGGTVMSVPKSQAAARAGKVVTLRKPEKQVATKTTSRASAKAAPTPAKTCACSSGGGSASDVMELRSSETGLKVMILGPDGSTRTRFVPAPHGAATARHVQDE